MMKKFIISLILALIVTIGYSQTTLYQFNKTTVIQEDGTECCISKSITRKRKVLEYKYYFQSKEELVKFLRETEAISLGTATKGFYDNREDSLVVNPTDKGVTLTLYRPGDSKGTSIYLYIQDIEDILEKLRNVE